jgi:hypothetical protein
VNQSAPEDARSAPENTGRFIVSILRERNGLYKTVPLCSYQVVEKAPAFLGGQPFALSRTKLT